MDARRPDVLTLRVDDLAAAAEAWQALGVPVRLRTEHVVELQCETITVVLTDAAGRPGVALGWEADDLESAAADLPPGTAVGAVEPEAAPGLGRRRAVGGPAAGLPLELISWR